MAIGESPERSTVPGVTGRDAMSPDDDVAVTVDAICWL